MSINVENMTLLHEAVLISDEKVVGTTEEVSYELFWDDMLKDDDDLPEYGVGRFIATKVDPANKYPDAPDTLTFNLTKHPDELTADERYRVLNYRLNSFTDEDEVELADMFLQGEFIEQVSYFKDGIEFCIINPDSL